MSRLYEEAHRALQDEFGTRALADRVEDFVCVTEFSEDAKQFIEAQDFFFLSTVDEKGRPTVSYKGGGVGFVQIVDSKTLIFPIFNGNGMYFSAGNILKNSEVGLLAGFLWYTHLKDLYNLASQEKDDETIQDCNIKIDQIHKDLRTYDFKHFSIRILLI